jgi:hypothetical protein
VLIRLAVFRWQMIRAAQQNPPTDAGPATTQRTDSGPTTGSAGG